MPKTRFWILLEKKLTGRADWHELTELEEMISSGQELRYIVDMVYRVWVRTRIDEMVNNKKIKGLNNKRLTVKNITMIRNYFKIAFRNLQKQKAFTIINMLGLSIGVACFSLLLLFTFNQFSFDKFHKNATTIYRAYQWDRLQNPQTGYTHVYGSSATTLGEAMKRQLPDVIDFVRFQLPVGQNLLRAGDRVDRVDLSFADASLFSVFSFHLKYGSPATALKNPNDVVLTVSRAVQLFGTDNIIGKVVDIEVGAAYQPFRVSGIAYDVPQNSSIQFDVVGNYQYGSTHTDQLTIGNKFYPVVEQTYLQLKPGSTLPGSLSRLKSFMRNFDKNFVTNTRSYIAQMKKSGTDWKEAELPVSLRLQPLLAIHTDTAFNGWGFTDYEKINPKMVWILLAIAVGILVIAAINFTTLSVGRSAGRSKEVGVRKVIGAERRQLISQFLTEAVLLAVGSGILGVAFTPLLLPWFNQMSGTHFQLSLSAHPAFFLLLAAVILLVGLLAGSYPAFVLSGFSPLAVLKNKIKVGGANLFTRSLVTFQFVVSISLVVGTAVIFQQAKFLLNKNPGFEKENIVVIDGSQVDPNKVYPSFKNEALRYPLVKGVTSAAAGLGAGEAFLGYSDQGLSAAGNLIDPDYLDVMGMHLVAGHNLAVNDFKATVKPIIINETMMRTFGWNVNNVIGKELKNFQGGTAIIAGVVKDFNYSSLNESVKNQFFETSAGTGYGHIYVRIAPGNPTSALARLQRVWKDVAPGIPMKYSFLDEKLNRYYQNEQRWSSVVGLAGGICIFLACLGLLGLATLAAVNRTKEIGVRKVLGASVRQLVFLIAKDFVQLILIAFVIATPITWYFMNEWLQTYANRIGLNLWLFFLAGTGAMLVAFLTISPQAIRVALMNPVKSLRTE